MSSAAKLSVLKLFEKNFVEKHKQALSDPRISSVGEISSVYVPEDPLAEVLIVVEGPSDQSWKQKRSYRRHKHSYSRYKRRYWSYDTTSLNKLHHHLQATGRGGLDRYYVCDLLPFVSWKDVGGGKVNAAQRQLAWIYLQEVISIINPDSIVFVGAPEMRKDNFPVQNCSTWTTDQGILCYGAPHPSSKGFTFHDTAVVISRAIDGELDEMLLELLDLLYYNDPDHLKLGEIFTALASEENASPGLTDVYTTRTSFSDNILRNNKLFQSYGSRNQTKYGLSELGETVRIILHRMKGDADEEASDSEDDLAEVFDRVM